MTIPMLYSKLHRACVTGADLDYEGSIGIDVELIRADKMRPLQQVEIYNVNNGERFSTYVIAGAPGEVSLNGAAARLVQKGDLLIIAAYCEVEETKAAAHHARVVLLGAGNKITRQFDQASNF